MRWTCFGLGAAAVLLLAGLAVAQEEQQPLYQVKPPGSRYRQRRPQNSTPVSTDPAAADTRITLEVFTGKEGVGYQAQAWETVFERAGLLARIHAAFPGDKISIRESHVGKLREVSIVAKLDRNGTLTVPGRKFAKSESNAFEEWLRELKTYGAQGSPSGQALWGLSQTQFDAVFGALSAPVEQDAAGLRFDEAVRALGLPEGYAFRLSLSAEKTLSDPAAKERTARMQLRGFSRGTALAMLLTEWGLGFRPNRTPAGKVELLCVADDDTDTLWPPGWDPPENSYPGRVAPRLFQQVPVDLKDQKLLDVLDAIADKTGTPIRVDFASIEARKLDLNSVVVSVLGQHMAWYQLLVKITSRPYLTPKIRTDEAKKPFVWVTSLKTVPAPRPRPATSRKQADAPTRPAAPESPIDR